MAADKSTAGRGALPDQAAQAVQSPEISQNKPSAAAQADTQAARPGCQPAQEDTRAAQTSAPVETAGPAAGAPAGTSGMPVPAGQSAPAHNPAMPLPEQGAGPAAPVPAQGAQAKTPAQANATQQAVRQLMTMLRPVPSLFEPSMRGKDVLPDDLPYAAEVQAALARRPSRGARVLSFGVMLFFAGFIFWASIATLDEVTHAEGQIIPSSRTQIIQNLEGGILSEVLVDEGQIVEKGAVMARIDNELAASSLRDAMNKAIENYTALCRLRAILKGEEKLVWPADGRG
ncbi:MAG: hypothetical protein Q4F72_12645, partial [Desulfovibrionaceae bacterium]|nr:hypothetical protein [Desulfovibrionaceae bacterium]